MTRSETIGDATLILGDCREVIPTLSGIDAIITDPVRSRPLDRPSALPSGGRMTARAPMTIREAQRYAARMGRQSSGPEKYYWDAVWWRLHAKESAHPSLPVGYARSQMRLYRDMLRRPQHYSDPRRPLGLSDWQWSGLGEAA